jgi:hypothetical protein
VELFVAAHSRDPAKPQNIFVVELLPYAELEKRATIPLPIQQLRQRCLSAHFWYWFKDQEFYRLAGSPSPTEDKHGQDLYWLESDRLVQDLDRRVLELKGESRKPAPDGSAVSTTAGLPAQAAHSAQPSSASERASANTAGPAVFLADTTEDLDQRRTQLRTALEKEGIPVLPESDYASLPGAEVEAEVRSHLASSNVFVQLLSPTVGKPRGARLPAPQLQFELARGADLPIMQWCDDAMKVDAIDDVAHKALFRSGYLQTTNLEDFKAEVIKKHHALVREAERASARTEEDRPTGKRRIFLDDWLADGELAGGLVEMLTGSGCEVYSLDADATDEVLVDTLRSCRGGISIYPNPLHREPLKQSLRRYLKLIAANDLEVARWGVYFADPATGGDIYKEFRLASAQLLSIRGGAETPGILRSFLQGVPVK